MKYVLIGGIILVLITIICVCLKVRLFDRA